MTTSLLAIFSHSPPKYVYFGKPLDFIFEGGGGDGRGGVEQREREMKRELSDIC